MRYLCVMYFVKALIGILIFHISNNVLAIDDQYCTNNFATGGSVQFVQLGAQQYCIHEFISNGIFEVNPLVEPLEIDYLVVAGGGGGGGRDITGGGGAGGLIIGNASISENYTINVGTGGNGGVDVNGGRRGNSGLPSSLVGLEINITAIGGGGGGGWNVSGLDGGSGGGAGSLGSESNPGSGVTEQGNDGGIGGSSSILEYGGGGGGGAGGPGFSAVNGRHGGLGIDLSEFIGTEYGDNGWFAGGGGGAGHRSIGNRTLGNGGQGGGGNAGVTGQPGIDGTGGGGGGARGTSRSGGKGGDGIVLIRYLVNTPPIVNAGVDKTVFAEQQVTLNGTASDLENNLFTIQWVQLQGTEVVLINANTLEAEFEALQPLTDTEHLVFELTVTDDLNLVSTDTVTITVNGVPDILAEKSLSIFSESGIGCDDQDAEALAEPLIPAFIPGACIEYVISVTNNGPVVAQEISIRDELPSNMELMLAYHRNWVERNHPPDDIFIFNDECSQTQCIVELLNADLPPGITGEIIIRVILK